MIYPTARAVQVTALAAPVALAVGVLAPGGWAIAIAWVGAVAILVLVDGFMAPSLRGADLSVDTPASVAVGEAFAVGTRLMRGGAEVPAEFALAVDGPVERLGPRTSGRFVAARRGKAAVRELWARSSGPLGLAWRQLHRPVGRSLPILPDIRPVRDRGMRQYLDSMQFGIRPRLDRGDGQEFQVLTEFQPGMERRAIDWKASARHAGLLAREYQTERDNAIVLAIDAGRAMGDPVGDVPRIDRAVSAALLAAFVALKSGDRVRLYAFAGRPSVDSGTVTGTRGFARLHHAAAEIDYGTEESNHTLSLVTLDTRLAGRSLIVLFTEFADTTGAELLLAAAGRLLKRHRVLFVLFRDVELETIRDARPAEADDLVRAQVAHTLLRERALVVERLRRMGVEVLEAAAEDMPLALVERYRRHRERTA